MTTLTFIIGIILILALIVLFSPNIVYFIHSKHFSWREHYNESIPRKNYLYTINRNGKYETIVDYWSNPILFLTIEKELGNDTYIIMSKELTDEEYKYYHSKN